MRQINGSLIERRDEDRARPVEAVLIADRSQLDRLQRLQVIAQLLDSQFTLPGTDFKFGLDAVIGLVPAVGDLLSAAISLWVVREARQLGAPTWLIARMLWNVAVDTTVGIVPLVGDAFDATWKANKKNVDLLTNYIEKRNRVK